MTRRELSGVTVQVAGGQEDLPWAEQAYVRKGALHVTGPKRQHRVFEDGEWKGFLAKPTRLPNSIAGD
jgi:hypothetical protein